MAPELNGQDQSQPRLVKDFLRLWLDAALVYVRLLDHFVMAGSTVLPMAERGLL